MSEEIRKLTAEDLDQVAGGKIEWGGDSGYVIVDSNGGDASGIYQTLEEAKFAASGICPRCGKTFSGKQAIYSHIKEWAGGVK